MKPSHRKMRRWARTQKPGIGKLLRIRDRGESYRPARRQKRWAWRQPLATEQPE